MNSTACIDSIIKVEIVVVTAWAALDEVLEILLLKWLARFTLGIFIDRI